MATINDKTYSASEHEPKTVAELLYQMQLRLEQAIIMGGYNPRGNYDTTATYKLNDAVVYNGNGYVHYTDKEIIGVVPTNEEEWKLYVSGVAGETGPKGPQGPKGGTGPQGPQGLQGVKGDTGARGPQGIQGEKGEDGAQGPQGLTGAQGARGPEGPQGIQGIQGIKGDTGDIGPAGPTGPQGIQGIQGPQGLTGEIGPQGPQGIQGPKGDKGDKGENGKGLTIISTLATVADLEPLKPTAKAGDAYAVGIAPPRDIYLFSENISEFVNQGPIQGPTGPEGPQGPQGVQGLTGATGPQGPQGPQGVKGATGATGATGPQGPQGEQGPQGLQGETGPQGPKGDVGPQGPAGKDGATGATGPEGPQGVKGDQGPAGENGTDGKNMLLYASVISITAVPTEGQEISVTTNNFNREPKLGEPCSIILSGSGSIAGRSWVGYSVISEIDGANAKMLIAFFVETTGKQGANGAAGAAGVGVFYTTDASTSGDLSTLLSQIIPSGIKVKDNIINAVGRIFNVDSISGNTVNATYIGSIPTGGGLPNYVSFETPTSINVSTNGNEVTYTGVAEFEADGSMKSGEYHQVLPMPVEMLIPAPVTDPPVVGETITLGSAYFNRQPLINEYFLLRTLSPTKNILTLAIAKCKEKSGANAVCGIVNSNNISVSPKKYAHNITIEAGNAVIGFTIFTSLPNAYTNALSVYASIGLNANQQIPASGVIGNNLPVYCIRMRVTGLAAIAVGMSVTIASDTEVKDIVVPL